MKEYDITIRETLEMTVTVEAESREEARQKVADNWNARKWPTTGKTANISWMRRALRTWSFIPGAEAATGMDDELFFRTSAIPHRGMERVCTSKHRVWATKHRLLGGAPPNTPLKEWRFSMEGLFFAIGFLLGGVCGVLVMCLLQINRRHEEDKE